jgi:hypothetical protein
MKRLAVWQKVGIVLSIVWAVGAAIYQHNADRDHAESIGAFAYNVCLDGKDIDHDPDLSQCEHEKYAAIGAFMVGDIGDAAFLALAPLPFAWVIVYVLGGLGRALAIGLPVVLPWQAMSRLKKILIVAGALITTAIGLYGVIGLLNLYTDSLTPVALSPFKDVMDVDQDTVVAEGTWTREGSQGEGSKMADPLQTSKIICTKAASRCIESRAYVSGNVLFVDQLGYDIESWSPTTIVFTDETPCERETFTIDRTTREVNGVGNQVKSDAKMCHLHAAAEPESHWEYHLENGFNTYWAVRQKGRPAPLRIFQAFWGN